MSKRRSHVSTSEAALPATSTEEPTSPGVPPAATPEEGSPDAGIESGTSVEAEAAPGVEAAADTVPALPEPSAEEIAEAAVKAEAEIAEAKAREEAEEAARQAEETRLREADEYAQAAAALQARVDACKVILRQWMTISRRAAKEDAVEWLERMHSIPVSISEAAFDQLVSGRGFGKETVTRTKSIEVQVDEFFLKGPAA